jgi:hypothetical protein
VEGLESIRIDLGCRALAAVGLDLQAVIGGEADEAGGVTDTAAPDDLSFAQVRYEPPAQGEALIGRISERVHRPGDVYFLRHRSLLR